MSIGVAADTEVTLGLASRWSRLLGQMIDGSFAAIPMVLAGFLMRITGGIGMPVMLLGVAWMCSYFFLADGLNEGQSFAKRWLGMRVIDAKTGAACTFGQSIVRNLVGILGPLDWCFIFGDGRQRLGDKLAGTIVVIAD